MWSSYFISMNWNKKLHNNSLFQIAAFYLCFKWNSPKLRYKIRIINAYIHFICFYPSETQKTSMTQKIALKTSGRIYNHCNFSFCFFAFFCWNLTVPIICQRDCIGRDLPRGDILFARIHGYVHTYLIYRLTMYQNDHSMQWDQSL